MIIIFIAHSIDFVRVDKCLFNWRNVKTHFWLFWENNAFGWNDLQECFELFEFEVEKKLCFCLRINGTSSGSNPNKILCPYFSALILFFV